MTMQRIFIRFVVALFVGIIILVASSIFVHINVPLTTEGWVAEGVGIVCIVLGSFLVIVSFVKFVSDTDDLPPKTRCIRDCPNYKFESVY